MFKNKKEEENEVEETFSLTAMMPPVIDPVMRESDAPSEKTKKQEKAKKVKTKKIKTPKDDKPNVLWAKISVVVIIVFVSILSLFKLVDYLNMPKMRFTNMIETMYFDMKSVLETIKNDSLFGALNMDGMDISIDSRVIESNIPEEARLKDVLGALQFSSNIEVDRSKNYIKGVMRAYKDDVEKFNLTYIKDEQNKYISIPNIYNRYIELGNGLDISNVNLDVANKILEILKSNISSNIENMKIESKEEAIGLNGKTVDCLKSTYRFSKVEMLGVFDRIYNAIKNDEKVYTALAKVFGIDTKELDKRIEEIKEEWSQALEFEISAYQNKETSENIRLELYYVDKSTDADVEHTIAYNREFNYKSIEIKEGEKSSSISIQGDLEGTFNVIVEVDKNNYTLVMKPSEEGKIGAISVIDKKTGNEVNNVKFSYTLENKSNTYSIKSTVEINTGSDDTDAYYKINSTALVSNRGSIQSKEFITDSIKLEEYEEETNSSLKIKFKDMLNGISIEQEIPELPTVFDENAKEPLT